MEKYNKSDLAFKIIIQDKKGHNITKLCKLYIYLSQNALFEFGKELINNALHAEYSDVHHFYLAGSGIGISENFGIIVHPESIEPIIIDDIEPMNINTLKELEHNAAKFISQQKLSVDEHILTDNIILFKVLDSNGNNISKDCRYVIIYMHKYSKITLGTELIRLAHNFEEGKEIHIVPKSEKSEVQQAMGIYLSPNSCELIIKCKSFDSIDKILEEYNKGSAKQ